MVDLTAFSQILTLAGSGTTLLGQATDIYQKIKPTTGGDEETLALASQLTEKLFEANTKLLTVQVELEKLRKQAERESRFSETIAKYAPKQLPAGGQILALSSDSDTAKDFAKICPYCAEQHARIAPLQGSDTGSSLKCGSCGAAFPNQYRGRPGVSSVKLG